MMVYLLLADGFEEVEALTPLDLLRRAGIEIRTVGVTGEFVQGAHGITVKADILPSEATESPDMLILPGGMPGTLNLDTAEITDTLLTRTLQCGGKISAICAAPMILGKRGLLKGKKAVCYPGFEKHLEGAFVADTSLVTDGAITTAKGMGVAFEFGMRLVSELLSEKVALEIAASAQYRK